MPEIQSEKEQLLGTEGFIFLDAECHPYAVKQENDNTWWLYTYRLALRRFTSLRSLTMEDVERYRSFAVSPDLAEPLLADTPV